jgi:Mg2+-importing ATPase
MSDVADHKPWWLQPLAESQAERAADAAGLSSVEARSRLAELGPNRFRDHQEQPLWLQFLARFKNPLVILLLVASAISALTGEITNFLIITAMVLFSVTLDFVQEHRAGQAAESLRHSVSVRARVIRDGKPLAVPVTEVVPGDLAVLSAGDMVPADGWVLEASDLFVKQALLTGEPYPVEKRPGALAADATDLQTPPTPCSWAPPSSAAAPGCGWSKQAPAPPSVLLPIALPDSHHPLLSK